MKCIHLWCLSALLIIGCGPQDASESVKNSESAPVPAEEPIRVIDGVTTIHMTGNDQMKYNLEAFTVPAGSQVKLVFSNIGKMPKAAMGHNVVILNLDVDPSVFATAAAKARDNDYIPVELSEQILEYTKLLGPGESDTLEFTAPEVAGEYTYLCSFPAHLYAGMRGVMTVVPAGQ